MKKRYFGLLALPAFALIATHAPVVQTPHAAANNMPQDADDGMELAEASLDQNGAPMSEPVIAERKEIADCLLSRFKSIPQAEHDDYSQTVGFYLPHKLTGPEAEWIEQRIRLAVAETVISQNSRSVESFVLKPSRTSRALEFCLAPKLKV